MTQEVKRNYLEINSLKDLKEIKEISKDYSLEILNPTNFQLNKFFYKNVGKKHQWVDRLIWSETQWVDYVSSKKVKTFIFKHKEDLVGFFELISHIEHTNNAKQIMRTLETFFDIDKKYIPTRLLDLVS